MKFLYLNLSIYRIDGRLVGERYVDGLGRQEKMDISSHLQTGAYIVSIKTAKGNQFNKLIVVN